MVVHFIFESYSFEFLEFIFEFAFEPCLNFLRFEARNVGSTELYDKFSDNTNNG